jgi:copper(I)-binding protein
MRSALRARASGAARPVRRFGTERFDEAEDHCSRHHLQRPRGHACRRPGSKVSPAEAGDYDVGAIHIADTWARATPKGASAAAGYMTVTNNGTTPDRLSCVSSDASAKCQIHSMTMENGVMKMRPVEGGLDVKPGESVMLKPAGMHMMFLDLKHPLEPGKTVAATLQFEKAGTVQVEFPIAAIGAPAPGAATGGGTMMQGGGMMQMKPQR